MSEETDSPAPAEDTPKPPRRQPANRPRRSPKAESASEAPASAPTETPQETSAPSSTEDFSNDPDSGEWPEPESASIGGTSAASESSKKKRRRRKGKGPNSQSQGTAPHAEESFPVSPESKPQEHREPRPQQQGGPPPQFNQRSKHDPDQLATKAWKIFLSEVGEEGVALIGDNDAKELSRRCFRLAEIFLDEQARHR